MGGVYAGFTRNALRAKGGRRDGRFPGAFVDLDQVIQVDLIGEVVELYGDELLAHR